MRTAPIPVAAASRTLPLVSLLLLGLLLEGCPRWHRGRHSKVDAGELDAMSDLAEAEDAGLSDARDARSPDAGDPDAAAAALDANAALLDANAALLDAGDALAEPDLVFIRRLGFASSLHTVNVRDFGAVRRLDPEPTSRFDFSMPAGYSPDGRKLLIQETNLENQRFFISYPCRTASCPQAPYYELAVEQTNNDLRGVLFAPDSSGIALQFAQSLWYVALGPERAEPAIRLLDYSATQMVFLRGGSALMAFDEGSQESVVFDLRKITPSAIYGRALSGRMDLALRSVAPDGEHFVVERDFDWYAYTVADLLADQPTERKLPGSSAEVEYVTNTRVVLHGAQGYRAVRWSGDDPVPLPVQYFNACEEQVIGCSAAGKALRFTLPGAAVQSTPLALTEVPGLPCQFGYFAPACTHFFALSAADPVLYELATGTQVSAPELVEAALFSDGRLLHNSVSGLGPVLKIGAGPTLSPAFTPRKPLVNTYPALAQHSPFLVAAGPLEKPLDPGLYLVDMSEPLPARLRRLVPERMEASALQLSPDDRYLSYRADAPEVPSMWQSSMLGVFEIDLQTGIQTRVSPSVSTRAGGPSWMIPIPGERAVLVSGAYDTSGAQRFYVATTRPDAPWIDQNPTDRQPWTNLMGGAGLLGSPTLRMLAGTGVSPQGPGVWLQTLSLDPGAPAKLVGSYIDSSFDGAYARDAPLWPLGLAQGLGLLFARGELVDGSAVYHELQRIEPESGKVEPSISATGDVSVKRMGQQSGRAFIQRLDGLADYDYGFIEAAQPQRWFSLLKSSVNDALSPDERWLVYTEVGSLELHCYELASRTHFALPLASSVVAPHIEELDGEASAAFTDETHALVRLLDGSLQELSLTKPPSLRTLVSEVDQTAIIRANADFSRLLIFGEAQAVVVHDRRSGTRRELLERDLDSTSTATISPDGKVVLARYRGDLWRAFDLERPAAPAVVLREAYHERMRFDRAARYVLGTNWLDGSRATVWELAHPDQPHELGAGSSVMDAVFVE